MRRERVTGLNSSAENLAVRCDGGAGGVRRRLREGPLVVFALALPDQAGEAVGARLQQDAPDGCRQCGIVEPDAQIALERALVQLAPGGTDFGAARHDAKVGRVISTF